MHATEMQRRLFCLCVICEEYLLVNVHGLLLLLSVKKLFSMLDSSVICQTVRKGLSNQFSYSKTKFFRKIEKFTKKLKNLPKKFRYLI